MRAAGSGDLLVGGGVVNPVSVTAAADGRLSYSVGGAPLAISTGSLAGLSEAANHVADQRASLDTMATQFAGQLNAAHQAGTDANGNPGQPLFTGTSAATLTAAPLAPDQVAVANASGSNGNMLAFGAMRGSNDPESRWSGHLATQAQTVASARAQDAAASTRADASAAARDGVKSGRSRYRGGRTVAVSAGLFGRCADDPGRARNDADAPELAVRKAKTMINAVGNRMTREIARQQKLADALERTQIQISGGKKLLRMSDDPVAARRIATIGTTQSSMAAWSSNINSASALVSQADGVMKSVTNLMTRARELTLAASSDTTNPADRATIAAELGTIADEIDALAATRDSNGEPVFATGTARVMRFDPDVTFAPVPTAADVFVVGGNSLSTSIRDAAAGVAAGDKAAMSGSVTTLATAIGHVADQHAAIGLSGGRLDRIGDGLAARGITLKDERSSVEDTNLDVAIAELNALDLTLGAARAAFAKINRQTLFDILN